MILLKSAVVLLVNLIMYLAFGSFFVPQKDGRRSLAVTLCVGFFAYYAAFAIVCLPFMLTYRPLSLLARIWVIPCVIVFAVSAILYHRSWKAEFVSLSGDIGKNKAFYVTVFVITAITIILTVITYNFTLDAAYYVAQVTTNVDTDMINVYDPFTGNWQDHFELRYVFSTYNAADSVICSLTNLPALVETKSVMSSVVMLIVNILYVYICRSLFDDHKRALLMYILMTVANFFFISIYTTSNFLMTRTYEGKSVVGNVSVILIFVLYMMLVKSEGDINVFLMLFVVCLGTATVSSTANMVIPAQVCVLFVPYALLHKKYGMLPKILLCIVPELIMMIVYVLYVKGYYAIYTFPR